MRKILELAWVSALCVVWAGGAMAKPSQTPFERDCAQLRAQFTDSVRLRKLIVRYWAYQMNEFPEYATDVGYPGLNDRWTDRSFAAIERRKREFDAPYEVIQSIRRASHRC